MLMDGFPLDLKQQGAIDLTDTPYYRIKTWAFQWQRMLEQARYPEQAARCYTIRKIHGIDDLCPPDESDLQHSTDKTFLIVPEQHYEERYVPEEGILLRKRVGNQAVAKEVERQYFERLNVFSRSYWYETAIVRATIVARFGEKYYVVIAPHLCYTTWNADATPIPVSSLVIQIPPLASR